MADTMSRTTGPTRAQLAHRALADVLLTLTEAGKRVPCAGDTRLIAEGHQQRTQAAKVCAQCPIITTCHEAGRHEKFGIWGGVDRTNTKPPGGGAA